MIWCVEDDASIRDIEVYALQSTGIEARGFEDETSFWEALNGGEKPELAVIDVMLPLSEYEKASAMKKNHGCFKFYSDFSRISARRSAFFLTLRRRSKQ